MPVRPEDFDAEPPRRVAPNKPITTRQRLTDKQARAMQEREMFVTVGRIGETPAPRAIPLAIAAVVVALILFVFWKPLSNAVMDLLGQPAHPVAAPETTNQMRAVPPESPPPQTVPPPDHAAQSEPETSPPTIRKPQDASDSQPRPIRKTLPDSNEAQALRQDLERRQAELEAQRKRLTDEQIALEAQRKQEAQDAARASEQAKQEELNRQQKLRDLEESLRAKERAATLASHPSSPYQGPSSGTLVWEGDVNGADLIDIQNGSPNHGTVTGMLPGVPCMVQASDPKRVTISTPPAPSNEWKRIVLRVQAKGHTTVTVRWALP
jgi:hypothetical protein